MVASEEPASEIIAAATDAAGTGYTPGSVKLCATVTGYTADCDGDGTNGAAPCVLAGMGFFFNVGTTAALAAAVGVPTTEVYPSVDAGGALRAAVPGSSHTATTDGDKHCVSMAYDARLFGPGARYLSVTAAAVETSSGSDVYSSAIGLQVSSQ